MAFCVGDVFVLKQICHVTVDFVDGEQVLVCFIWQRV